MALSAEETAQWYPRLFRTALRLTGSVEDAADVTQQAFCRAIQNWHRYNGRALRTTWLYRIVINCVRDWARQRCANRRQPLDEWEIVPVNDSGSPVVRRLEQEEQMAALRKAIEELPETVRRAFVATVLDGFSYQEAAEILDVPVGTIASRVSTARKGLLEIMRNAFPEA